MAMGRMEHAGGFRGARHNDARLPGKEKAANLVGPRPSRALHRIAGWQ